MGCVHLGSAADVASPCSSWPTLHSWSAPHTRQNAGMMTPPLSCSMAQPTRSVVMLLCILSKQHLLESNEYRGRHPKSSLDLFLDGPEFGGGTGVVVGHHAGGFPVSGGGGCVGSGRRCEVREREDQAPRPISAFSCRTAVLWAVPPRPMPTLGPFEIDHKSAARRASDFRHWCRGSSETATTKLPEAFVKGWKRHSRS